MTKSRILSLILVAVAATGPALAADAPTTIVVDNPYGLDALWTQGDFVSHGALIILGIMSSWTWYILVTKLIEQSKLLLQAGNVRKSFWTANTLADAARSLKEDDPFRAIATAGIDAISHHEGTLVEQIDLNTWVTVTIQRSVDSIAAQLQAGLAVLATVGSTAPFVGLFGTVWGIYHALTAIGIAGQASIDKVAGPVGEALIMTAIGLAVAVPAVLGYNWLVRRNKAALDQVRAFAADLHAVLLSGARVGDRSAAPQSATRSPQAGRVATHAAA